ncbi:MAG: serine phosphatase RsbU (regulator of sigma subunit) [Crocinitomix sp.]|jgi:serine phosphatase RsbU (regulator of sigma subunit)
MRLIILMIVTLLSIQGIGQRINQNLVLKGTVFGYTYNDTKSIFKKDKKIELEGSLANVQLKLKNSSGEVVGTTQSSSGGEFNFKIPTQDIYTIIYSKSGYGTSAFDIDLKSMSKEIMEWGLVLKNIEIILNNYESDKPQDNGESFGGISFNENNERFEFKEHEFPQKKRLFKKNQENTTVNLMELSLDKNATLNVYSKRVETETTSHSQSANDTVEEQLDNTSGFSEGFLSAKEKIDAINSIKLNNADVTPEAITSLEDQIKAERALLKADRINAVTEIDYLNIAAREKLLESAERELANAKSYISEQQNKLKAQQNFIYAIIGVLVLFLALAVLLWLAYRQKKKNNIALSEKNKKIQDSINYALKIQRSVLLSEDQIKAILPKSFVYYQPLDSVSGDFYWFSKIKNKTILAAVDCTGHGVPGAFMSLIGNTLMNQIVNEDGVIKPSEILEKLNAGIVQSLQQTQNEESAQDGMDISVCCIDHSANSLTMAGAMNAVYLFQDDEIKTLKADLRTIGGYVRKGRSIEFKEQEIAIKRGDRIYMFSDGFMDQFGGTKDEKYNISRFKKLIIELKDIPVDNQEDAFRKSHLDWKGNGVQTDDILVVGAEV